MLLCCCQKAACCCNLCLPRCIWGTRRQLKEGCDSPYAERVLLLLTHSTCAGVRLAAMSSRFSKCMLHWVVVQGIVMVMVMNHIMLCDDNSRARRK